MAENPVALAEAARKVVDTLGALSPPAFLEIGVARLSDGRLCNSERFEQEVRKLAAMRVPTLHWQALSVSIKGHGSDCTRFVVEGYKHPP